MRRNGKVNFKEQRNKEVARHMYAMRQIDRFIKWTVEARIILKAYVKSKRKKRPGVHSKNRNTKQKTGKYYSGTTYRGQGR